VDKLLATSLGSAKLLITGLFLMCNFSHRIGEVLRSQENKNRNAEGNDGFVVTSGVLIILYFYSCIEVTFLFLWFL
jgi:hypothetical protein